MKKEGINVFLAPDNIDGGSKFTEIIIEKIQKCSFMLVLLSKKYKKESDYTNHEIGVALGCRRLIVPVCIDKILPYGLISGMQCVCARSKITNETISNIIVAVCNNIGIRNKYRDILIENAKLANSNSKRKKMDCKNKQNDRNTLFGRYRNKIHIRCVKK